MSQDIFSNSNTQQGRYEVSSFVISSVVHGEAFLEKQKTGLCVHRMSIEGAKEYHCHFAGNGGDNSIDIDVTFNSIWAGPAKGK